MDVALSVSLSLLVIVTVFSVVFLLGKFSHHDEKEN